MHPKFIKLASFPVRGQVPTSAVSATQRLHWDHSFFFHFNRFHESKTKAFFTFSTFAQFFLK